jgi:uroporphyrinogen-III synthase
MSHPPDRIPVLLLKTRSTPVDTYDEYFSNEPFTPTFVPVLEHRPNIENVEFVRSLLLDGKLGREHNAKYGGIIFTSQRAVEGFAKAVDQAEADSSGLRSPLKFTYSPFPIHRSILHRVTVQPADLFGKTLMRMT